MAEFLKSESEVDVSLEFDWSADEESNTAKTWLNWCRQSENVKCVEADVPAGILPRGCKGILIDVKVFAKGPDDKLYAMNPELRAKVARGNCVLELNQIGKNGAITATKHLFLVFALKKFSGGMGDEDDSPGYQNQWQNYFIQPIENAVTIISMKKANGEAAHVAGRKLFNRDYFCIGSKNVHLLVQNKCDIENYKDGRYLVARTVAETFFRQVLENEDNPTLSKLVAHMQDQKCTMVSEILQPAYQHVENLSYLQAPEMLFICWTSYTMLDDDDTLCPTPPNLAIDEAREFALKTVDYEIIEASEAEKYMANIRSEFEYEGRVLYFLDGQGNVIGVLKKKTAWYIILRAIREKVCHFFSAKNSSSLEERRKKTNKRIAEIQTWLGFSDEYRQSWNKLAVGFVDWISTKKSRPESMAVRSQFPNLWKSFLENDEAMLKLYQELEHNYT